MKEEKKRSGVDDEIFLEVRIFDFGLLEARLSLIASGCRESCLSENEAIPSLSERESNP